MLASIAPTTFPPATPLARMVAVLCPDWPVTAAMLSAEVPPYIPAAVLRGNQVLACSALARRAGVHPGQRRRDAQRSCPDIVLLDADPARDTRVFEPVVSAVDDLVASAAVVRPGLCIFPARGASRYFGGEGVLAERLIDHVAGVQVDCHVGIADGVFAASLAAAQGYVVPAGQTPRFLAKQDIAVLGSSELVSLLRRLGLRTLGDFAQLSSAQVLARFGTAAARQHRLIVGVEEYVPIPRPGAVDLTATSTVDPPVNQIAQATGLVRSLAASFNARLAAAGLACTRLMIAARTTTGQNLARAWRAVDFFTEEAIATRLRWQLESWLTSTIRPTGPLNQLSLVPEELIPLGERQRGLWGEDGRREQRAYRALAHAAALLDPGKVTYAFRNAGRTPHDQVKYVPFDEVSAERLAALAQQLRPQEAPESLNAPWPGQLPSPVPATLFINPIPVKLTDARDDPVVFTERLWLTSPPHHLCLRDRTPMPVHQWSRPWPITERWWDPQRQRAGAWLQVIVDSGSRRSALLLYTTGTQWWVIGNYD